MESVRATYYLDFGASPRRFIDSARDFFSTATLGTTKRLSYVDAEEIGRLRGAVTNVAPDADHANRGLVTYEFDPYTFQDGDLAILLSYLLYSAVQNTARQIRLVDVELPSWYASLFPGPTFGVRGLRAIVEVHNRPLLGAILKPRQGLTPLLAGRIAAAAAEGDVDYVVDDEMLVDQPKCPLVERARTVVQALREPTQARQRPVLYVVNVTGSMPRIERWADVLTGLQTPEVRLGLLVNGILMGFPAVSEIRSKFADLPLVANTVGSGMLILGPEYNISEHIFVQLSRLAGADAVYTIWHAASFMFDPSKVDTLLWHLRREVGHLRPSMPVYAGAISLGSILRGELPSNPDYLVQAGTTICSFQAAGIKFPDTIRIATKIMSDALTRIYVDGETPDEAAISLLRDAKKERDVEIFRALGFDA
jgi:ribulose 1,5-bisphosphate carboxylase large subunit-like protein